MSIHSNRACPLCGSRDGYSISDEVWEVVALGRVEIGFRICHPCGFVLQDPVVPRDRMLEHYSAFSNYTNPGRSGKPSPQKVRNVARQIRMIEERPTELGRTLQVGCSDGYTLSEFSARGWQVDGIDPSPSARSIARSRYGIQTRLGDFESATDLGLYDLVIATHVLEHVYEPVSFLEKIALHLDESRRLLLEVPCLVQPEFWPNGIFTFEHVQYFSPGTLESCLARAGFEIQSSEIHTAKLPYPVICVVAELAAERPSVEIVPDEYDRALTLVEGYRKREDQTGWRRIEDQILPRLERYESIAVWGAGIHTSQLMARTNIARHALRFIVDSDRQKVGHSLAGFEVCDPSRIETEGVDAILISTLGSESAVYESTREFREKGIDVICLYGDPDDSVQ